MEGEVDLFRAKVVTRLFDDEGVKIKTLINTGWAVPRLISRGTKRG